MTGHRAIAICLLVGFMIFKPGPLRAQDPAAQGFDRGFSPEKEKKIDQLQAMEIPAVFASLRSEEFFDEEEYLNSSIYRAFNHRSEQAVQFALGIIRSTRPQEHPTGPQDFYIAKQILQIFSDQSLEKLLDLYGSGGPKVRKNVIEVLGQMSGGQSVRVLLVDALDDRSFCEEEQPESIGEPLRICDVAYNQLVIRYKIKNVPRVIGSIHAIDTRDYNIRILKDRLAAVR
ncbi:MAG: hypothetical protein MUE70_06505 [Desulfobacterales bacterium]|jgi:hypothetical protein|nr:hypothetical protein [Desulfobacterales bacterium]